jgi:quercetin dioxygenase-like cupin family protein
MSVETGKVWGKTKQIIDNPFVEMHHIRIKPSSYCSQHEHRFKSNHFYCLKGMVIVKVWKEGGLIDETVLLPGSSTVVNPGEVHMFETPKISSIQEELPDFKETDYIEVIETYYPSPISPLDIRRKTQGGSMYTVDVGA